MAAPQRIKGQEITVLITRGGILEDQITEIMNLNIEMVSETKVQGYLGEKNDRTDDIFNHVKFDMEIHPSSQAWFTLAKAIQDRQKRITPDVVINITAVLQFPNGDAPSIALNDCKFESIPHNIGSRGDYMKSKLSGVCDDISITNGLESTGH